MRLRNVKSVVDMGYYLESKGYHAAEGPYPFGPVQNVHGSGSLHYVYQALDVNNYAVGNNTQAEHEALVKIYKRILRFKRYHPSFPLDEMFHRDLGYIKEYGVNVNHPISNHDSHLHIGFWSKTWA